MVSICRSSVELPRIVLGLVAAGALAIKTELYGVFHQPDLDLQALEGLTDPVARTSKRDAAGRIDQANEREVSGWLRRRRFRPGGPIDSERSLSFFGMPASVDPQRREIPPSTTGLRAISACKSPHMPEAGLEPARA